MTALVALGSALFDIAEVARQLDESREGVAVVAAFVAAGHLAVAAIAGRAALRP